MRSAIQQLEENREAERGKADALCREEPDGTTLDPTANKINLISIRFTTRDLDHDDDDYAWMVLTMMKIDENQGRPEI